MTRCSAIAEQQCSLPLKCGHGARDGFLPRAGGKSLRRLLSCGSIFYTVRSIIPFLLTAVCPAQSIRVLPPDNDKVIIHGRVGDDASFSKRITLMSDQAVTELIVRPGDL